MKFLNITPDDVDTLTTKATIAQAEGDLPRAAAELAPLHPTADDSFALEAQVYQAILERRPAPILPRLKEILAKPDPALGYFNGELRFYLGWAQEVAGDHAAAQESWRQARSELESFFKEQPENYALIVDLALTNMGLGDKAAAFALIEKAIAAVPIEKDALDGPMPLDILARVSREMDEPDRAVDALQKLLSIPYATRLRQACRLLLPCFGSIPCSIHCAQIPVSENFANKTSCDQCNQSLYKVRLGNPSRRTGGRLPRLSSRKWPSITRRRKCSRTCRPRSHQQTSTCGHTKRAFR
jgi:hypothetical protein